MLLGASLRYSRASIQLNINFNTENRHFHTSNKQADTDCKPQIKHTQCSAELVAWWGFQGAPSRHFHLFHCAKPNLAVLFCPSTPPVTQIYCICDTELFITILSDGGTRSALLFFQWSFSLLQRTEHLLSHMTQGCHVSVQFTLNSLLILAFFSPYLTP